MLLASLLLEIRHFREKLCLVQQTSGFTCTGARFSDQEIRIEDEEGLFLATPKALHVIISIRVVNEINRDV